MESPVIHGGPRSRDQKRGVVFDRLQHGSVSPPVALMELLIETEDVSISEQKCRALERDCHPTLLPKIQAVLTLIREQRQGCERIVSMLRSGMDSSETPPSLDAGLASCKKLFDWSVQQSEEASVALYSLGNSSILAEATTELVECLEGLGVLAPTRELLDIGCGIGRLENALASHVESITGIDVSGKMLEVARRRCAGRTNVSLLQTEGRNLRLFAEASFDCVLSVDAFPYLVQAGGNLAQEHFAEARRVLRPGGDLVLFNYSYRDDLARDIAEVTALGADSGFRARQLGTQPLRLWNAALFHLSVFRSDSLR